MQANMQALLRIVRDLFSMPSTALRGVPAPLPLWLSIPAVQDLTAGAWWAQGALQDCAAGPQAGRPATFDARS